MPNKNADLTANNSESFRYTAAFVGETEDTVNNTSSSIKTQK